MTEKEYRILRLKEITENLKGKKIALYGTGRNAEAIIEQFEELNIVVLIDEKKVGKYVYGKKVISFESALFLELNAVIIAAEAQAEREIVKRILFKCLEHNIKLFNMYGFDVISGIHEEVLQDIDYIRLTKDQIKQEIDNNNVVCIEVMSVLVESSFYNKESMWKYLERTYNINQFSINRSIAEKKNYLYQPYNIFCIYDTYLADTFVDSVEIKRLLELEESTFLDSLVVKAEIVDLLQYAVKERKNVFLVSDLPYSDRFIENFLKKIGIGQDVTVIQESIGKSTFSAGLIRDFLAEYFKDKVLYLGNKESIGYYIVKSYGFKRYMIKSSLEYCHDLTEISYIEAEVEEKLDDFKSWIIREHNSPFYQDNLEKKVETSWKLFDEGDYKGEELNVKEVIKSENISDYKHLLIPSYEDVEVSIVIPVYNHFEYTYMCLQTIIENTEKVCYEIILADDCSTDMTTKITEVVDGIKVIKNDKKMLFLKNCNNAVKYATGKYIVFLNNDTQVQYNWLYPLMHLLDIDSSIGMTGSKLLFLDGTVQEAGGLIYKDGCAANYGRGKNPNLPEFNYVRDVDYISGASIMIRRDLWDKIGGFDERYAPAYYEDSDLAFEVRKHGMRVVYQPASKVIHFEGISNGKKVTEGIKKYQEVNSIKFSLKWKNELEKQCTHSEENNFVAKDRKQKRKTVLFISGSIPTYDRDAGSKSIMCYIKLFLCHDYIVKFWPLNMYATQPYLLELQQMGVEVLYGQDMKKKMSAWVLEHQKDIEYALVNYPDVGNEVIDLLKVTSIKVRYYGHDLHYLRMRRQYVLNKNENCLAISESYYKKEKRLIEKSEWVYYPSDVEVEIVKKEFGKENIKQISLCMYDKDDQIKYEPEFREGIIFVGGSHGPNEDAVFWFLREIYPDIYQKKKIPLFLIGADHLIKMKQVELKGVINTGYISDDELTELYHKVRMAVIPLRYGAGVKGKVVDAMYHRVPIISTSIGIEGIPMSETCTKIADNAEMFKKYVLNLYDDYAELRRMSDQYNGIIRKHFSMDAAWEKIKFDFG